MSTIASNAEDLILNADGGSSTVKIKINGTEKASISSAGAFTSTTIDATKLTGALPAISGAALTSLPSDVAVSATAPGSPSEGDLWFNSSSSTVSGIASKSLAVYNATAWKTLQNSFSATGGTVTTSGGYTIHTFTSSGTFTPNVLGTVDYLVVAGGGGAGMGDGAVGAAGAGGFRTGTDFSVTATAITVTVGAGGAGRTGSNGNGSNGANSVFSTITSIGGGYGAGGSGDAQTGGAGGSGGGSNYDSTAGGAGTSGPVSYTHLTLPTN